MLSFKFSPDIHSTYDVFPLPRQMENELYLAKYDDRYEHIEASSIGAKKPYICSIGKAKVLGETNIILNSKNLYSPSTLVFNPLNPGKIFNNQNQFFSKSSNETFHFRGSLYQSVSEAIFLGTHPNFGHWLFNHMARLIYFFDSSINTNIIISQSAPTSHVECLLKLGIPAERILTVTPETVLNVGNLFVPIMPWHCLEDNSSWWTPNSFEHIRNMFGINSGSGTGEKLVYLTRSNTKWRRVTNEIKLFERLEQLGFEMIDPGKMSIDEQLLLAQQTRLAISPMGAGSNYFLFMKDGTRFIELTPQNKLMNVSPMFAKRSQIKFQQVLGTPMPSAGQNELDSDFEVDIEALIKLL